MKNLWTKVSLLGLFSAVFGSGLWSHQQQREISLNHSSSPYELRLVQVLFRHGARTPLWTLPDVVPEAQWKPGPLLQPPAHTLVPYVVRDLQGGPQPPSLWEARLRGHLLAGGAFPGQLTALGMQQVYDVGRRMRRRYVEEENPAFLGAAFSPEQVYVRSTNMARTIESARCLVAGLFDRHAQEVVPIATTDTASEILLPNHQACELLRHVDEGRWAEIARVPGMAADLRGVLDAMDVADRHRGSVGFVAIRDDMVARATHGLPLPAALEDPATRDTVERRAVDAMLLLYQPEGRPEDCTVRLCVGPLLRTMVDNMEDKLASRSDAAADARKLILYSAHDTTLMPCLMALGIFDGRWPPYAADLALELHRHRQTGDAFVKVSYLGRDQLLPGCSDVYCPLGEFKKALAAYSLSAEQYSQMCSIPKG